MTIRFAAAATPGHSPACLPIAKALAARAMDRVANDNGDGGHDGLASGGTRDLSAFTGLSRKPAPNDHMLKAALRHFAEHGLGAAREARAQAEQAFFAGDRQAYDWWVGITRTLDRRLAEEAERLRSRIGMPSLEMVTE